MVGFTKHVRWGSRALLRASGSSLAIIISLALAIGACTTIFSLINSWVLRPLPFAAPDRLMVLRDVSQDNPDALLPVSLPNLEDLRRDGQVFTDVGGLAQTDATLSLGEGTESIEGALASPGLFRLVGARPARGREFSPEEGQTGAERVAILSHRLWEERLGSDPRIVGQPLKINGEPHVVIGIMPKDFELIFPGAQVWLPLVSDPQVFSRDTRVLVAIARLKPGIAAAAAQAQVDGIARRLAAEHPKENAGIGVRVLPLQQLMLGPNNRRLLGLLMGSVLFVLLIACFNVANLLLVRSAARSRDFGVRSVLGADRWSLIRQLLTESLILGTLGGAGGLFVAYWGMRWLVSALPVSLPRLQEVGFDARVLLFTLAIGVGTTLLFGLIPAILGSRVDLRSAISAGTAGSLRPTQRLRSTLVAAEIALALILLALTALTIRSVLYLQNVEAGFEPRHVLTLDVSIPSAKYAEDEQVRNFSRAVLSRVSSLSGVQGAAAASVLPRSRGIPATALTIDGRPPANPEEGGYRANWVAVSPSYFSTLGIPIQQGRSFNAQERADGPRGVVIDETAAKRFFPGENPVGKRLTLLDASREVVGVAGAVLQSRLVGPEGPQPTVYLPLEQVPVRELSVILRTAPAPESLAATARRAVWDVDSDAPVRRIGSMESYIAAQFEGLRLIVQLLGIFAVIALVLAVLGVYGVVSYATTNRMREFGIRLALGAQKSDLARTVIGWGMTLTVISLVIGLAGAVLLASLLKSLFFGVTAADPVSLGAVSSILLLASLLAMYFPVRRAMGSDPLLALRSE